jgi:hypothetical protein
MIISLDLDQVLIGYVKGFGDYLAAKGFNIPEDRVTSCYSFTDWQLKDKPALIKEFAMNGGLLTLDLLEDDAPQVVKNLIACGHEVIYNSSRGNDLPVNSQAFFHIYDTTAQNLKKHGFPVNGKNLFVGQKDKNSVTFDWHCDDHLETLISLTKGKAVCYNQPYNQEYKGLRVNNLKEFAELIKEQTCK